MTSAADRSRVLARVCESELAAVRRASSGSAGANHPTPTMRRHAVSAMSAATGRMANSDEVLCNSGSSSKSNGARSEAVGINAAGAGAADDDGDDPYAELEFYLENVKVSADFFAQNAGDHAGFGDIRRLSDMLD